jgi:hypothetical protein
MNMKSPADAIADLMKNGYFDADSFYVLAIGITNPNDLVNYTPDRNADPFQPAYCRAVLGDRQGISYVNPKDFYDGGGLRFSDNAVGLQNLIKTDHHVRAVPVAVAKGLADSFLAGLIARLYSAELFDMALPSSVSTSEPFPLLTVPDTSQLSDTAFKVTVPNEDNDLLALSRIDTYITDRNQQGQIVRVDLSNPKINPAKPGISEQIWMPRFIRAQRRLNFKVSEMLAGWKYGCRVLGNAVLRDELVVDLKSLISQRFKASQCWKITGYVLTYLEGWSKGIDTVLKRKRNEAAFNDPPETVLDSLATVSEPALGLILYNRLVVIATGLTLDAAATSASDKVAAGKVATEFQNCVAAYNQGISSALPELFADAYNLGFERGYQSGFMDGHAAAAVNGIVFATPNSQVAENIRNVFKGATPTLEGTVSFVKDVAKVWTGDFSPVKRQVDKAKNWVKKTFGFSF